MRRTHGHLKEGDRHSNVADVKRYLNVATIDRDGLLVFKRFNPLQPSSVLIIVLCGVINGPVNALHIRFDHPSNKPV